MKKNKNENVTTAETIKKNENITTTETSANTSSSEILNEKQKKLEELKTKIDDLQHKWQKAIQGYSVKFDDEDAAMMNKLFVEVYRRPKCPTCSGDKMNALDLYIKKILREIKQLENDL